MTRFNAGSVPLRRSHTPWIFLLNIVVKKMDRVPWQRNLGQKLELKVKKYFSLSIVYHSRRVLRGFRSLRSWWKSFSWKEDWRAGETGLRKCRGPLSVLRSVIRMYRHQSRSQCSAGRQFSTARNATHITQKIKINLGISAENNV